MAEVELFVGLLVAVVLGALAGRRLRGIPHVVALVVGGVGVGLLPFAPAEIGVDPELIFLVFLPPILYPSAFRFATEDVRGNLRPIALLSIGLVLATIAAVAVVAHLVGIPWAAAFVLGAVLAPTDPVVATSVIRAAGAPQRLATILEGESLINDGSALTALRLAIAAVGGSFALGSALGEFVVVAVGGAAIGAALAWATSHIRRSIDDLELESTIAVLLAYGSFLLAERLGVSGILATVFAGWVMGHRSQEVVSPGTRMGGESFWGVAQFLAESVLFLLVGLAFAQVLDDPASRPPLELAGMTALVVAVIVAVRFAWMFTLPTLVGWFGGTPLIGARERVVVAAAGMRGAVSVAAALSIPATSAGTDFPERNALIVVALGSIVTLLVLPAFGLPALLRAVDLQHADDSEERERRARDALADAALSRISALEHDEDIPEDVTARARERYEWRLQRLRRDHADDEHDPEDRHSLYRRLRREALDAQRDKLAELRDDGEVSGVLLRRMQRDLDLDETRSG